MANKQLTLAQAAQGKKYNKKWWARKHKMAEQRRKTYLKEHPKYAEKIRRERNRKPTKIPLGKHAVKGNAESFLKENAHVMRKKNTGNLSLGLLLECAN